MENKKSFVLYCDIINTVEKLSDKDAGLLLKHILNYVNDRNPKSPNFITEIAFEPIKQQLKRDLIKWGKIREKRSDAGKKSAKKRAEQKATNSTSVKSVKQTSTNPTVNVNANVNVTVINIKEFWDLYHSYSEKPKTDLEAAKKHWKKLTEAEKQKAIDNTKKYINSINDKKYIVKARTYLSDKLFNNEFESSYLKPLDKLVAHSALNVPALKNDLIGRGYTIEEITKYAKS